MILPDAAGVLGTYTERHTSAGAHAAVRLGSRVVVRAAGHSRWTAARDPFFSADGPTWEAAATVTVGGGVRLLLDGFYQARSYTERTDQPDRDRYRQAGLGLEADLSPRWSARVTAAVSRYTWPDGAGTDNHRWQAGVSCRLGGAPRAGLPGPGRLRRDGTPSAPRSGAPWEFRLHAPGATTVALVGDFNGWDPAATPLHREGDGWWRTALRLPAGTHLYAYVVDGAWRTPPEATATAPDGFGGSNGVLVVLP